jgi:hypothetical protein
MPAHCPGDVTDSLGRGEDIAGSRLRACRGRLALGGDRFGIRGRIGSDVGDLGPRPGDRLGHFEKVGAEALRGLQIALRADHRLDSADGGQQQLGIGAAVAPGIFFQEPASTLGLHQGGADGLVVALRGRRGMNGRKCGGFFGHIARVPTRAVRKRSSIFAFVAFSDVNPDSTPDRAGGMLFLKMLRRR